MLEDHGAPVPSRRVARRLRVPLGRFFALVRGVEGVDVGGVGGEIVAEAVWHAHVGEDCPGEAGNDEEVGGGGGGGGGAEEGGEQDEESGDEEAHLEVRGGVVDCDGVEVEMVGEGRSTGVALCWVRRGCPEGLPVGPGS